MMNFLLPPGEICDGSQEGICLSVAENYRPRKDDQTSNATPIDVSFRDVSFVRICDSTLMVSC